MAAHLEDVSTDDLIREVQRRIECTLKPEKHVVLIGKLRVLLLMHVCIGCVYLTRAVSSKVLQSVSQARQAVARAHSRQR